MARLILIVAAIGSLFVAAPADAARPEAIVCLAKRPTAQETLAAKEIRRYVYLTTNKLLPIVCCENGPAVLSKLPKGDLIAMGHGCRMGAFVTLDPKLETAMKSATPQGYVLKTVREGDREILVLTANVLYSAYRLAERLGVRFYLEGDVIPEARVALDLPAIDDARAPLFDTRGIQPFHDFPEGPDWWSADGYKAVLAQLPKLRMNFVGLHTYPQGGVGPEPLAWIGTAADLDGGKVKAAYPSRHFTTANGTWGYQAAKTGDYSFGAAVYFDRDDYGNDTMPGMTPWPATPDDANELFNRVGALLGDTFDYAHHLGVKTCIGTETPLIIPDAVKARLKAAGKDPGNPAVVQELYEGMFQRIMNTHALDYYWFWTPEGWTWEGTKQEQIDATLADFRAAMAAAEKVHAPFTLATCGWVLGPQQDRALFDNALPKNMPMSCINREVGHAPVEPGFAKTTGRPKWAIPWMEDDPAMIIPQLWAGRMRKDALDAKSYGCTGLLGIHWRTRPLGPNVSALATAAWDQGFAADAAAVEELAAEGPDGGKFAAFAGVPMASADEPAVYQTVRYDVAGYRFDVPDGKYKVTLKFVEPAYGEARRRVFGVNIQGKPAIDSLDIFAVAGKNKAYDRTFDGIEVASGRLAVDFVYQVEFPCIAGIVLEGEKTTRKINCGGAAVKEYAADWPPCESSKRDRYAPIADFYADWAKAGFGAEAAQPIGELFAKIDGRLPRPATWVDGPGGINPDPQAWTTVEKQYAFVEELAALRSKVQGANNLERFDYWLENFRYLRAVGQVNCIWARYNEAMAKVRAEANPDAQKRLARELALPLRKELVAAVTEVHRHLLATVSTSGELGTVANWQQHLLPKLLTAPGAELAKILGEPLPEDAMPGRKFVGSARLIVPVVRTMLIEGEPLRLTAIVAGGAPGEVALFTRPLGQGEFKRVVLAHAARGVFHCELAVDAAADFEYYLEASAGGAPLRYPASGVQTVVVAPR